MSIAAVPAYLRNHDPALASPALRFGMLLPIWTDRVDQEKHVNALARKRSAEGRQLHDLVREQGMDAAIAALRQGQRGSFPGLWEKNDFAARDAWGRIIGLNATDRALMTALGERQAASAVHMLDGEMLAAFDAVSTAPFTTGLGNEHPLENGFAFLNPYGLPYLPGSGIKGVLRQAARELAAGQWDATHGWTEEAVTQLFGAEDDNAARRGALVFHDVIPQVRGQKLMVEIMTPHQKHYYQDGQPPHDSGTPVPIKFLTLPPETGFRFLVGCNRRMLDNSDPDLGRDDAWKPMLEAAFEHAFAWLGFGAKTAVGYGAMRRDHAAEQRRYEQAQQRGEAEARRQALEQELAGLDPDAADLVRTAREQGWQQDKSALVPGLSAWLESHPEPSPPAVEKAAGFMTSAFPGIMQDPDATQGRKNKPKFKPVQSQLARQLIGLAKK